MGTCPPLPPKHTHPNQQLVALPTSKANQRRNRIKQTTPYHRCRAQPVATTAAAARVTAALPTSNPEQCRTQKTTQYSHHHCRAPPPATTAAAAAITTIVLSRQKDNTAKNHHHCRAPPARHHCCCWLLHGDLAVPLYRPSRNKRVKF